MKMLIWLIGSAVASTPMLYGGLVLQQPLSSLVQRAELIVVGSASGNVAGSTMDLSLSVTRVIKGVAAAGTAIAVQSNVNGMPGLATLPGDSIPVAGNGIWFLRRSATGWSLLPVVQGAATFDMTYFPAPLGPVVSAAYSYAPTAAFQDKLASELSAAIESLNGTYNLALYGILNGDLEELNSPVVQVLYRRLSGSTSVQQQILGFSGLIRHGNVDAFLSAVSASPSLFSNYGLEYGMLISAVRNSFRPSDPSSIAALGKAAVDSTSPSLAFRQAAAHALAAIHTAATLPYLAALLDDPHSTLRVEAVGGMGAFANGLPIQTGAGTASLAGFQLPASAPYKTPETISHFAMGSVAIEQQETSYVSFWKQWWSANKASIEQ